MASYRNISINFWTDSKVDDEFTPEDKYFYLYLLTNPHSSLCGCYEISMKQMERETGYNADTIKRLIDRMEKTHKVIRYSAETKEILILNWYKFNWSKSDKVRAAIVSATESVKNKSFKAYIFDKVWIVYQYRIDTVCIPNLPVTVTDTVTDTVTVSDTENRNIYADSKSAFESEFADVWNLYPRKEGKSKALTAYIKARKEGETKEAVLDGLNRYLTQIKAENTPTQYIKHGSTWFNQRCWHDTYRNELDDINENRPESIKVVKIEDNSLGGKTKYYADGTVRVYDKYNQLNEEIRK
jgi:hypothetical protein